MTTGDWVYGLPHLDLPNSTAYFNECSYRICWNPETGGQANAPIKNGTLSQFTGLHDKKGVGVWEGDIIADESKEQDNDIYVCEYSEKEAMFVFCSPNDGDILEVNGYNPDFEIIGNIHENPELL